MFVWSVARQDHIHLEVKIVVPALIRVLHASKPHQNALHVRVRTFLVDQIRVPCNVVFFNIKVMAFV
jgi:hypothetical protein